MDDRLPLSVLLLARDERAALEALLPALAFAREIVVVLDSSGEPSLRDLATRHGARVFERALDGFGAQRQFALEQCTQEWVLWLDADERPDATLVRELGRSLDPGSGRGDPERAGLEFVRRTWFLGRRIRFCGWQDEWVLRAFRRERARFDDAPIHERVVVDGRVVRADGTLKHHSYATFDECVAKMVRYARAGAERARSAGRRAGPLDVLVRPPLRFARMYVLQLGFLDGAHGLVLCAFAAAQVFLKYARLWSTGPERGGRP